MIQLNSSITEIKGIGEKNAALFQKLNIATVGDLLFHFPRDYEMLKPAVTIRQRKESAFQDAGVYGTVTSEPVLKYLRGKNSVSFEVKDEMGTAMTVTYFHMPYLKKSVKRGNTYVFFGQLFEKNNRCYMTQPRMYRPDEYRKMTGVLRGVYVKTKGITDASLSKYVKNALNSLGESAETFGAQYEYLPEKLLKRRDFSDIFTSLKQIHFPENTDGLLKARERFSYEELFLFLLSVKSAHTQKRPSQAKMLEVADTVRFIEKLPFQLTDSQKKAWEAIQADLCSSFCMNRLLQGDVGSGKTILAILAMLMTVANGYQAVFMAPTEVLARQHYTTILEMTEKYALPFRPALLTGSVTAKDKKQIYQGLAEGSYNVAIGTQALIQDTVSFQKLALAITDEQHRFGVRQRELLQEKGGGAVHTIVMSATPIPRSLAIVLYGELDITEMSDMPAERLPIKNCVVDQSYRMSAYKFMNDQILQGHQCYIICPMAEAGVMDGLENVVEYAAQIREFFPESVRIEYLHGKLRPKQKNEIMERFAAGQTDILVSTTVVEVGVNVPNATVMMVENAERFGLATLHQIRGRVGRGAGQSYCIFMESGSSDKKNERLEILNHSNNGFEIARKDLELRGPGDLMGIEQSGEFSFRFADVYRDHQLVLDAASDAEELLQQDPTLSLGEHKALGEKLEKYIDSGYMDIL